MTRPDLTWAERACAVGIERMGFKVVDASARAIEEPTGDITRDERFRLWLHESLLVGLRALKRGDSVLAFRCALQASEYCGRIGGFWPSPGVSDAYSALRNELERVIAAAAVRAA